MYYNREKAFYYRRRFPFFLLFPVFFLGAAALVMLLWNAILPDVIQVKEISYLQAIGLLVLSRILFGGFRGSHRSSRHYRRPIGNLREKWMNMSDEEKAKFKEEWRKRCHYKKP